MSPSSAAMADSNGFPSRAEVDPMNERKGLSDTPPRGALVEGAEKFDRTARAAKPPSSTEKPSNEPRMTGVSPDEVWARSYMTYAIGSKVEPPVVAGFAPDA